MTQTQDQTCRSLSFWLAVVLGVLGFLLAWKWLEWGAIGALLGGLVVLLVLWFVLVRALCGVEAEAAETPETPAQPASAARPAAATPPAAAPAPEPSAGPAPEPAPAPEPESAPPAPDAASDAAEGPARPPALDAPRGGQADDLKKIKGIGPALEKMLNGLGIWHYDQIAAWTPEQVAWIDANLPRFKGRASRDDWVGQARALAGAAQEPPAG